MGSEVLAQKETRYRALSGNEAAAQAMRQIEPVVVAAYPITPQTEIVQLFSNFVSDGLVRTEFVPVESEHSALSAVVGAASSGVRAMTATSSNGLALMFEILNIASGLRLPIVMTVVNRALSAPINIHCDHGDTMGVRDAGWIQLYAENAQETYDNLIQAVRIAEHPAVRLPVMVAVDGFIVSHGIENVEMLDDQTVKTFIGTFQPDFSLLDPDHIVTIGPLVLQDSYFEIKRLQVEAVEAAYQVITEVGLDFEKVSGRCYQLVEEYRMEEAETAVVALGSTAGNFKEVVDQFQARGVPVGLLKLRVFRPFPAEQVRRALARCRAVAVMDRAHSLSGQGGPLFTEVKAALQGTGFPAGSMVNYVYGLGGREITLEMAQRVVEDLQKLAKGSEGDQVLPVNYLGLRE